MEPLNHNQFENAPIVVEHYFKLEEIENCGYVLDEELTNAGWYNFLDLDLQVYTGLVRQFMANVVIQKEKIISTVLKMHVCVDKSSISKAIGCADKGLSYFEEWINENPDVDSFLLHEDAAIGERVEVATQMKVKARLLHCFINKRFIQCDQDDNQVTNLHKFCIYNILKNKEVNLPLLIFNTIKDNFSNANRIYYPIVLSKIMIDQGVMNVLDRDHNNEKKELLFGPSLDADWFDEDNLRQLNFPILPKHEEEDEWEEEFEAEDDMEGESDAEEFDADWFDEDNLRQLNPKHEAGTSSYTYDEDDAEEEWEEEFEAEDDMEGESDAEDDMEGKSD